MSDNQRRTVCRIVFLVLCALPTFAAIYAVFHRPTTTQWQNLIRAQSGIPVQIAAVETPVPFTTILRGVRIPDSFMRGGIELNPDLRIDEIRIDFGDTQNVVSVVQPIKIPMESLSHVVQRFMNHFNQIDFDHKTWRVEFAKVVLADPQSAATDFDLKPVIMSVGREDTSTGSGIRGQLMAWTQNESSDGLANSSAVNVSFDDDGALLKTGNDGVPARLLRFWYPELRLLGSHCHFHGKLTVNSIEQGTGTIRGQLLGVELDRLAAPYDLGLVGQCDINDLRCDFQNHRLEYGNMRIESARPFNASGKLLTEARKLGVQSDVPPDEKLYTFPNLDLQVVVDQGSLFLFGDKNKGSVISMNQAGDAFLSVHPLNVTVHELATILTGNSTNDEAIEFLSKFRIAESGRIARRPGEVENRY